MTSGPVLDAPGDLLEDREAEDVGAGHLSDTVPAPDGPGLVWVRRIGLVVLAVQLVGLFVWSAVLVDRYALTYDFSVYHQAWWLLGHGNLNPFDTPIGLPVWADHGEFLLWPLALVGDLWPHTVTQLWVQDAALVGAEAVAFLWACDLAGALRAPRMRSSLPALLAATGLVLLVADPWVYWTVSFDFHMEPVGILFILLAGRSLHRDPGGRRFWLWAVLALACGDVVTTFVLALGLAAALAGRQWRRNGLLLAAVALAWELLLVAVGADKASVLTAGYGYLAASAGGVEPAHVGLSQIAAGTLGHPGRAVGILWSRRLDIYAQLAPAGLIGILSPWAAVTAAVALLENGLNHYVLFIVPGFQDIILYVLLALGTVDVLVRLARRRPRWAAVAAAVVALNAVAWGTAWLPRTVEQWLRVSPAAAAVLSSVQRQIPVGDQVVASQGVVGRFSERRWIYPVFGPSTLPVHTSTVWVIVAPTQGIETAPIPVSDALVAELAGPLHATLVAHDAGIWAFRWNPAAGTRDLVVPSAVPTVAAWTTTGPAGRSVTTGPSADWRAVGTGVPGYVVAGDYWRELPGRYQATVELSTSVAARVEVWDATGDVLLARRDIPPTNGFTDVPLAVDARRTYPTHTYAGAWPFRILPVAPQPGDELEVRVWSAGGGLVSVSAVELTPAGSPSG